MVGIQGLDGANIGGVIAGNTSTAPGGKTTRFGVPVVPGSQKPLLVSVLIDTAGAGMFLPLSLLFFVEYQGIPAAVAGSAVTLGSLLSFLFIPACGRLVQRAGPKVCLVVSNVLTGVGYSAYFLGDAGAGIAAAALLVMLGDRLYGAAWPTAVARIAAPGELTRWFSFVNFLKTTCLGLGSVASTGILALLGTRGLALALLLNVASSLVAGALVLTARIPAAPTVGESGPRSTLLRVLRDRPFMALVASQTLLSAAWLIPTVAFPVYLVTVLHQSPFWPTVVVAVRYGVIALLQVPLTARVAGWPRSRVLFHAIGVAAAAIAVTLAVPAVPGAAQGGVCAFVAALLAIAELVSKPTASAAAVSLAPSGDEGPYMAVFQVTWTLAYAVGPAVIGVGMGAPQGLWLGLGGCVLASAAAHACGRQRRVPARSEEMSDAL
ncbi:MFS transporter [Streptomyces sp. NPDC059788]|uniref:MFS transporter n=1 Tax=Streptomyces sp. NPDC059788 TaxID=3346948 RepID=UPI0036654D59